MSITKDQFIGNLVASGLMTAEEMAAFQDTLPPESRAWDLQVFARALVRAGKITKYQAGLVYQGRTNMLVLGEYEVLDRIGAGGMGEVLKARHRRMDRLVALKVLRSEAMKSADAVNRFHREVRAVARLNHRNIVTAYDASEHRGIHYLVMEYVVGQDLSSLVRQHGPLEVEQAVDCIRQAAAGLGYAHANGVIHRDIKPGNLLVNSEGTIRILDMGLARIKPPGPLAETAGTDQLTASGQVMGTCDYMAPEQAEDPHGADHRADIYSLGCTLYRLVTGEAPYRGDSLLKTLLAHREGQVPSLVEARPDVPARLDAVFQKMVAKDPEERYQSMAALITDLDTCLDTEESTFNRSVSLSASSTDSALRMFLQNLPQTDTTTRQKTKTASPETVISRAKEDTAPNVDEDSIRISRRGKLMVVAILGGTVILLAVATVVTLLVRGRPEFQGSPEVAGTLQAPGDEGAETPRILELQPGQGCVTVLWPEAERAEATLKIDRREQDLSQLVSPTNPDELRIPLSKGEHTIWIARRGYEPLERRVPVPGGEEVTVEPDWRKAAPGQAVAGDEPPEKPDDAGQPVVTETVKDQTESSAKMEAAGPQGLADQTPPDAAVTGSTPVEGPAEQEFDSALDSRRELEARYAAAMVPVDELAQAWDFRGAGAALERIRFGDQELMDRLAVRRDEFQRMAQLKEKVIAKVKTADPPLTKSDLQLRGQNGTVAGADEEIGLRAELPRGKRETHPWGDLDEKATARLLQLAVDPESADDWLAAALIASASGDAPLGERLFGEASSRDAKTDRYRSRLAQRDFAKMLDLLDQEQYGVFAGALDDLEEKYESTSWLAASKAVVGAARRQAELGLAAQEKQHAGADGATGVISLNYKATFRGHNNNIEWIEFTPDSQFLASLCQGELFVWTAAGIPARVKCDAQFQFAFSPDGSRIVSVNARDPSSVALFDVLSGTQRQVLQGHVQDVTSLAISPDGKALASGSMDMTARLWLATTGAVKVLTGHTGTVTALAFSPDGAVLASGSDDQSVRLWDTETGEKIRVFTGHSRPVLFLTFSPDGTRLVSAGRDNLVRIWDAETGSQLRTMPSKGEPALFPDGKTLACVDNEFIMLWNTETGNQLLKVSKQSPGRGPVAISRNGRTLASVCDVSIDVWEINTESAPAEGDEQEPPNRP